MKKETKKPSAPQARSSSFGSLIVGWANQGVASFLATQRILVDFATRKNASFMKTLREGVFDPEHSPVAILTELTVQATANFTEAQRILLNLAREENDIVMTGVKDRLSAAPTAAEIAERLRHSIDIFIEMQQDFLTTASKYAQQRLQPGKHGKGADNGLLEAAREEIANFVRAQKKFLEVVVQDGAKATGGKQDEGKKKTEVSKLAHEALNSFIEAQKKLLDLAGQQVNANVEAASRAVEMVKSFPPIPLPNLSGEWVKSFVDAEKSLIDKVIEPRTAAKAAKGGTKAESAHKRPARRREPENAKAAQAGA